ncbi:MAG: transketolase family protein [Anaerolineales bacterium]|nr:transketolase family protein [Anaerolineales bacterium]
MSEPGSYIENVYGHTLADLGAEVPELVVLDSDLQRATETEFFRSRFPERYFDLGIQEANMIGVAAGLALAGKTVFCGTFACFISQRALDQAAISLAYCQSNVKLVGVEAGLVSGRNGASHQAMLDLAIFRALPQMSVLVAADAVETRQILHYLAKEHKGPAYLRVERGKVPVVLDPDNYHFQFGRAMTVREGSDLTIITAGVMVARSLKAAELLAAEGISARVLNLSTLKPLDVEAIQAAANQTGAIVVAENHSIYGGLFGAVSEVVCQSRLVPVERIGVEDCFGEVGSVQYLAEKFGLTAAHIAAAVYRVLQRKG